MIENNQPDKDYLLYKDATGREYKLTCNHEDSKDNNPIIIDQNNKSYEKYDLLRVIHKGEILAYFAHQLVLEHILELPIKNNKHIFKFKWQMEYAADFIGYSHSFFNYDFDTYYSTESELTRRVCNALGIDFNLGFVQTLEKNNKIFVKGTVGTHRHFEQLKNKCEELGFIYII